MKRSARSSPRPIVLPSRIPDTESDSATSADMSASRRCCSPVMRRRTAPTRRVIHTDGGTNTNEMMASRQSSSAMATSAARTVVALEAIVVAVVVTTRLQTADVVGDPRLNLARPRPREERERHPLEVVVDGRPQVVHHPLADLIRHERLPDAGSAGEDRDPRSSRARCRSEPCRCASAARCQARCAAGTD